MCTVSCHGGQYLARKQAPGKHRLQPCVGGDQACDQGRGGRRNLVTFWVKVESASCWGPWCLAGRGGMALVRAASPIGALVPRTSLGAPVAVTGQGQAVGL